MKAKTYVLYHAGCSDGFAAATIALCKFPEGIPIPVSYGEPPPEMEPGSTVFILDFSYGRAQTEKLVAEMGWCITLDHHESRYAEMKGCINYFYSATRCGSVMAWEYFYPNVPIPVFLQYIQDRDLWQWRLDHSRAVSSWITHHLDRTHEAWSEAINRADISPENLVIGYALLSYDNRLVERAMETVHMLQVRDISVPAVNSMMLMSEIGDKMLRKYPGDLAMIYYHSRDEWTKISLRGNGNIHCGDLAATYGGGGHKCAAGFRIKTEDFLSQFRNHSTDTL